MTRRVKNNLIVLVALCSVGVLLWIWVGQLPGNRFYGTYKKLELGMSSKEVQDLFGKPFDWVCEYSDCRIAYLTRGSKFDENPRQRGLKKIIENKDDLPDLYGNAQFLFSREDTLLAYSWNGEELRIHTVYGDFRGTNLRELSDEVFQKIVAH